LDLKRRQRKMGMTMLLALSSRCQLSIRGDPFFHHWSLFLRVAPGAQESFPIPGVLGPSLYHLIVTHMLGTLASGLCNHHQQSLHLCYRFIRQNMTTQVRLKSNVRSSAKARVSAPGLQSLPVSLVWHIIPYSTKGVIHGDLSCACVDSVK
jgi:hypothetical protein